MSAGRRRSIVVERIISAPPAAVFAAWSDPESLRVWMRPGEIESAEVEVDFRVGGRFRILMRGEREYVQHGEYLEIDPPRRLVLSWISEWAPEDERHTRVTVTFEPTGDGHTRLRLLHDELPDSDTYDGHADGWAGIADELSRHVETP